jgi:hypothetical protein
MVEIQLRGQIPLDVAGTLMNLIGAAYPSARVSSGAGGLAFVIDDLERIADPSALVRAAQLRVEADEFNLETHLLKLSAGGAEISVPHALSIPMVTMVNYPTLKGQASSLRR